MALAVGLSCIRADTVPPEPEPLAAPSALPAPSGGSPQVRVGIITAAQSLRVGGDESLEVLTSSGALLGRLASGEEWMVRQRGPDLVLDLAGRRIGPAAVVLLRPVAPDGAVRVNGRSYHGQLELVSGNAGLTAINQLGLEQYLPGVVGAEMGARPADDHEALEAQAIVSRTYALRNRGRWAALGFDFRAGVSDQVYAGMAAENPGALAAVRETAGLIVTWNGHPIDAFFFSTCGGRTELGSEVFRGANTAYLQSVPDLAPDGRAYCSISPRFHWRAEFTGSALRAALRQYLPAATSVPAGAVTGVRDIRITGRTVSGRARTIVVDLPDRDVALTGPVARRVLRDPSGDILRSTLVTLEATRAGREVTHLTIDGHGAGHGVGFCQWGAVGRARAGQRHAEIIAAYFPGTRLERAY